RKPFLAIQKTRGGNLRYLAPEVRLEVEDLSGAVDIYSLGVILLELLTGAIYDDNKPESLTSIPGADLGVQRVVRRAVSRNAKERYATSSELYEDLRSLIARGESPTARPASKEAVPALPSAPGAPPSPPPSPEATPLSLEALAAAGVDSSGELEPEVEGEEPTEAFDELADLSSAIELIDDPRATNVNDIAAKKAEAEKAAAALKPV